MRQDKCSTEAVDMRRRKEKKVILSAIRRSCIVMYSLPRFDIRNFSSEYTVSSHLLIKYIVSTVRSSTCNLNDATKFHMLLISQYSR